MDDTILLHDNSEYVESQGNINYSISKIKRTNSRVYLVIFLFLIVIFVQNMCIFMYIIKIKEFAEKLDLGWLNSDEMYVYKKKFETIIDSVCKLYIKC